MRRGHTAAKHGMAEGWVIANMVGKGELRTERGVPCAVDAALSVGILVVSLG